MTDLEKQLRSSLRRQEPSDEFTGRVLAELRRRQSAPGAGLTSWRKMGALANLRWAVTGLAAVLFLSAAVYQYRNYRQSQAEAELVKQRVILALRIASSELNRVQRLVQERPQSGPAFVKEQR